jgi:hypothetical protein
MIAGISKTARWCRKKQIRPLSCRVMSLWRSIIVDQNLNIMDFFKYNPEGDDRDLQFDIQQLVKHTVHQQNGAFGSASY